MKNIKNKTRNLRPSLVRKAESGLGILQDNKSPVAAPYSPVHRSSSNGALGAVRARIFAPIVRETDCWFIENFSNIGSPLP